MIILKGSNISVAHGWLQRWAESIIMANMPQHEISSVICIICSFSNVPCHMLITHKHCRHVTNAQWTDTRRADTVSSSFQKLRQAWVTRSCLFYRKVIANNDLYRNPECECIYHLLYFTVSSTWTNWGSSLKIDGYLINLAPPQFVSFSNEAGLTVG